MGNTTQKSAKTSSSILYNEDLFLPNPENLAVFNNFEHTRAEERVKNALVNCGEELTRLDMSRGLLHDQYDLDFGQSVVIASVEELDFSSNKFTSLPLVLLDNSLCLFKAKVNGDSIRMLNLFNNKLNKLDGSALSKLVHLRELNLGWNQLMDLPEELFELDELETLNISRNKLSHLSEKINQLKNLRELNASLNRFDSFPDLSLPNLQLLLVCRYPESNGDIKQFPKLNNMPSLRKIHWRCHSTQSMSFDQETFESGQTIEEVDLSFNSIPIENSLQLLGSTLVKLRLCACKLSTLPDELRSLSQLKYLYLRMNKFDSIPSSVYELTNLVELDLSVNQITTIDDNVEQLVNMEKLGLACNKIDTVPLALSKLNKLKLLRMEDNPIMNIDSATISKGAEAIISALLNHSKEQENAVDLSRTLTTSDRIFGCLLGQCVGDAMGLATEFLTFKQSLGIYGIEPFDVECFWQDGHRSRWIAGDYTDDSDQMLLIMDSIIDKKGELDYKDFANRLFRWIHKGYEILGDSGGHLGLGRTVKSVVTHSYFLKVDPHDASKDIWERSNKQLAANGAVMRTCILGILNYKDIDRVIENTKKIAMVTHYDPRAIASCIAVTTFISQVLSDNPQQLSWNVVENYIHNSYEYALKELRSTSYLNDDKQTLAKYEAELKSAMYTEHFHELNLDDDHAIGYTFKSLGSAFTSLRHLYSSASAGNVEFTLNQLIIEAGDADSNACVAGSLLGCLLGSQSLPQQWIESMPHANWLQSKIQEFMATISL